ncbi:MAG: hypothetical protein AABX47_04880 [Nanoarchaeota archaeon]
MANQREISNGKAYGFFYCAHPEQKVGEILSAVREITNTPSQLELSSIEGMDSRIKGDDRLTALVQEAKRHGINYMLQATCPRGINATDEAAAVLNQAYQSPLYRSHEPFKGAIYG